MAITTSHDLSRDLTIFTASEELTYAKQMTVLRAIYGGDPTANMIWDFRAIEGNRISSEELEKIISFIKQRADRRKKGKTALVSGSDLDFGLSRISEFYAEIENLPWQIRAFRSMDDALKWIDEK
jgi:hypothetical protein